MTTMVPVRRDTRDIWDVADEMDRVFDSPFELLPRMRVREGLWHPTMDIHNRPHELLVELELPGVTMEDLDLTIQENHLILEGSRRRSEEDKEDERFYSERLFGAFHRVVHLPAEVEGPLARMYNPQPRKAQILHGDVHGPRDRGCRAPLELEPDALVPANHQQVQLGPGVGRP